MDFSSICPSPFWTSRDCAEINLIFPLVEKDLHDDDDDERSDWAYLQQLSNCVRTLDAYYATGGTTLVSNTYTTGVSSCQMTAPVNGYYNVCVHARSLSQCI